MVVIACINFMNLATARSAGRAKEVGVRKVAGASRRSIIMQFLSEALVITFLSLALGAGLVKLSLTGLNQVKGKGLLLDFSNWQHWSVLLLLGLFTGVVAGTYPAFFLVPLNPYWSLKEPFRPGKERAGCAKDW
jgi:ABC-type antimicrobial peptide transport system permease subunit